MTWDRTIKLYVDVEQPVEPFVAQDAGGVWRRVKVRDQVQGSAYPVTFQFVEPDGSGGYTKVTPEATDTLFLEARDKDKDGASLYGIESGDFTVALGEYTGTLDLSTAQIGTAVSTYPRIDTTAELLLTNAAGAIKNRWQFAIGIERHVITGDPSDWSPEDSYYTSDEVDALLEPLTEHVADTENPNGVTASQAGADPAGTAAGTVSTHNTDADAHANLSARTPAAHAASHTDGTDDIQSATNAQKGLATAPQITALESALQPGDNGDQTLTFSRDDADPDTVIVTGAGTTAANGTYARTIGSGAPADGDVWEHPTNDFRLRFTDIGAPLWEVWVEDKTGANRYYTGIGDASFDWSVVGWSLDDKGEAPAPTTANATTSQSATLDPDGLTVSGATAGNLASFDADGKVIDGGDAPGDYDAAGTAQGIMDTHEGAHPAPTNRDARNAALLLSINEQTGTTYTLVLADAGKAVTCENADPVAVTVPANAAVEFAVGTVMNVLQTGAGAVTVEGDTGVTVNGTSGGSVEIAARWQGVSLLKTATDTWIASGAIV